jgi:hypothetical protein
VNTPQKMATHRRGIDTRRRCNHMSIVSETVHCDVHGETPRSFVCRHLIGESTGLGFHREVPSEQDPFPDAWCDNCEIIRAEHGSWDDVPEDLQSIALLCTSCYERVQIRNSRPTVTLGDLAGLRWKCSGCDEWHSGPMLDLSFDKPTYWTRERDEGSRWNVLSSGELDKSCKSFLDEDYCVIDDEDFFVRGIIHLPIIGAAETFRWGIWGSLSRTNFETLLKRDSLQEGSDLPAMFSWLSSSIPEYPDTLSLKMFAHIQEPGMRPHFWMERGEHPLAMEYHYGISPERVKEIMFRNLPPQPA